MNRKVIIINGAIGSGKSTLKDLAGEYFLDRFGITACLDLDDLYKAVDYNFSAEGHELNNNWEITRRYLAKSTDFFFENNFYTVFVVGPFFTNKEIEAYTKYINTNCEIFLYTLKPNDDVLKERILGRGDEEKDIRWINRYLENLETYYNNEIIIIDNSNLSPEKTLDLIFSNIQSGKGEI